MDIVKKEPVMTRKGNTVVFSELDDLYTIRYAKGNYTTSADIKNAPGSVVVRANELDENGEYRVELSAGEYTFCVQYLDESYNYYTVTVE